ncbi:hypothetical protein ACK1U3_00390 [Pseudomonas promysalinigenes]|uniref:hypothetical protein n=1 Tax=Pseudomonas promysalinigenes TaxID=485898 RepID=UPI0039170D13
MFIVLSLPNEMGAESHTATRRFRTKWGKSGSCRCEADLAVMPRAIGFASGAQLKPGGSGIYSAPRTLVEKSFGFSEKSRIIEFISLLRQPAKLI